jgi:hypothetical protein
MIPSSHKSCRNVYRNERNGKSTFAAPQQPSDPIPKNLNQIITSSERTIRHFFQIGIAT